MCLVNDEVQPIALFADGIRKRLPYGIGTAIAILCELGCNRELLGVQEIDMSILEHFLVKGFLRNRDALRKANLIGLGVYLLLGLLIQLRRIRKPDDNGIRLLHILLISEEDGLNQRRHDDCLSGSCRCSEGNHLWRMRSMIAAHRLRSLHADI